MHISLYDNDCPFSSRCSINTIVSCRGSELESETSDKESIAADHDYEDALNEPPNEELTGETLNIVGTSNSDSENHEPEYNSIGE